VVDESLGEQQGGRMRWAIARNAEAAANTDSNDSSSGSISVQAWLKGRAHLQIGTRVLSAAGQWVVATLFGRQQDLGGLAFRLERAPREVLETSINYLCICSSIPRNGRMALISNHLAARPMALSQVLGCPIGRRQALASSEPLSLLSPR
jgi:hypothetical protein